MQHKSGASEFIDMYICIYIDTHIYVCINMNQIRTYMQRQLQTSTDALAHMYSNASIPIEPCTCLLSGICMCMCIYAYAHK